MSHIPLTDALLARIAVRPNPHPHHLLTEVGWVDGAPDALPAVVGNVFKFTNWTLVPDFAAAAAARHDFGFNAIGFRFPEGLDRDDEPFDGVLVYDYFAKVVMSQAAFDRICAASFDALVAHANARTPEVLTAPWWGRFEAAAAVVRGRAG